MERRNILLIAVRSSCATRFYEFSDKFDVATLSGYEDIRLWTVFISGRDTMTIRGVRTASVWGLWRGEGTDKSAAVAVAGFIKDSV
jgi:hypothetical protein